MGPCPGLLNGTDTLVSMVTFGSGLPPRHRAHQGWITGGEQDRTDSRHNGLGGVTTVSLSHPVTVPLLSSGSSSTIDWSAPLPAHADCSSGKGCQLHVYL